MGLDITAYRKLEADPGARVDTSGYPEDPDRTVRIETSQVEWTESNWEGRTRGVTPGLYKFAEAFSFRAGAYSGYNRFRDWLAHIAGFKSADQVWEKKPHGPFVELIDFADNEGVIGPEVAAKLARDFADCQGRLGEALGPNGHEYRQLYAKWRKAFEMAADGGVVRFH